MYFDKGPYPNIDCQVPSCSHPIVPTAQVLVLNSRYGGKSQFSRNGGLSPSHPLYIFGTAEHDHNLFMALLSTYLPNYLSYSSQSTIGNSYRPSSNSHTNNHLTKMSLATN